MCGVTIFRRMFRSLGMTWWRSGCSGPRHTSWCIQVSRNASHASGENTDCSKSQLRADMQAWASSSNAHIYIRAIFCSILSISRFLHFQCCTEQRRYGNVHTAHTCEAFQYRKLSENYATYHKDTIRFRKAYRTDHRHHHSTHLFLIWRTRLLISVHPSTYLSLSFLARSKNFQKLHVRPPARPPRWNDSAPT